MRINNYIYGFILVLGLTSIVLGAVEDVAQKEFEALIEAEQIEICNFVVFSQFAMIELSQQTIDVVVQMPAPSPLDDIAINHLIRRGVPEVHARFVCNYLLINDLPYPGKLCFLTSNTCDKYRCMLPQDFLGMRELFRFSSANHHEIIAQNYRAHLWNI